jgi:Zn finger protein HypA/HybF involved in hydrogenase expression
MKTFYMRDEHFNCENCNKEVPKLLYSARDHCPFCLFSKHVDINPGDRQNDCHGLLEPVDLEKFKNSYKIIYKCQRCQKVHKNIVADDDDAEQIILLSTKKPH